MRIPAAIYPFSAELLPAVKYFERLQDRYTLTKLISLPGFGLGGKDAAYACNQPETGFLVTEELWGEDPSWETLLVSRHLPPERFPHEKMVNAVRQGLKAGKEVLYFDTAMGEVPEPIWELANAYPERLGVFTEDLHPTDRTQMDDRYGTLRAPVMLVGGLAATADSFEVLTGMALGLQKKGLQPLVISRQPLGKLFRFHSLNHIFNSRDGSEADRILGLNTFLQDLERRYLPDLILMEAPDPVMRYNNIAPNGFGIRTYMLCQAAPPDYLLCCVPCDLAVGNFLEMLSDDFSHRLGAAISGVCVSNFIVDSANLLQTREVSYGRTGMEMVYRQIEREGPHSKIPMFYAAAAEMERLLSHLLQAET
ncbi:MAG: hypothetical protein ACLTL5_10575 [Oscillospiraceae bacterium]|jgi:hypothetical protein